MKRIASMLMVLVMMLSLLPTPVFAGSGAADDPYQIGDIVLNDGSAEPAGDKAENSYWVRSDVAASEELTCTTPEHDHLAMGCAENLVPAECTGTHPEGETASTHGDGTACTYNAEDGKWYTMVADGYACGAEDHAHSAEAGCYTVTGAYTVWTLTAAAEPTVEPTVEVTTEPTVEVSTEPTVEVTTEPTVEVTATPTVEVTTEPTVEVTATPTVEVTATPTVEVTAEPTVEATEAPADVPIETPTEEPTAEPTQDPGVMMFAAPRAAGATITVSGSSYRRGWVIVDNGSSCVPYYVNNSGVLCTDTSGTTATFAPGSYMIYYCEGNTQPSRLNGYYAQATIGETAESVTVSMKSERFSNPSSSTAISKEDTYGAQMRYSASVFYNTNSFNHAHLRTEGSYYIDLAGASFRATVSNPTIKVYLNNSSNPAGSRSWPGTTDYEWTLNVSMPRTSYIEVVLVVDLTYKDASGKTVTLTDVEVRYNTGSDMATFIDAIRICDMVMGFDFTVTERDIQEAVEEKFYSVTYNWRLYNADGTYSDDLPAGFPG